MKKYLYRSYGLVFETEFELPELGSQIEGIPDVFIKYGTNPEKIENPATERAFFQASPNHFLLKIEDVASYYVKNGEEIIVEPFDNNVNIESIKIFMMGTALTALLHQRRFWPIHASGIQVNGHCIAFSGKSGVGKSTLAAHFHNKGYEIVSDDVCALSLTEEGNSVNVTPGVPQIKLWEDALKKLDLDSSNMRKVRNELRKFGMTINDRFRNTPIPLKRIYLLEKKISDFKITDLKGVDKFQGLMEATHKPIAMTGQGNNAWLFKLCHQIAPGIEVKRLEHPYDGDMEELISFIEKDLEN